MFGGSHRRLDSSRWLDHFGRNGIVRLVLSPCRCHYRRFDLVVLGCGVSLLAGCTPVLVGQVPQAQRSNQFVVNQRGELVFRSHGTQVALSQPQGLVCQFQLGSLVFFVETVALTCKFQLGGLVRFLETVELIERISGLLQSLHGLCPGPLQVVREQSFSLSTRSGLDLL